ncbi:hypothetical protein PV682_22205 [Streptomyces niveiscabiei]|uniref:hypothetical protein n=1 Tax=Streptomyces niveiscabiei TaxID=164115 RepID=UPI0029A1E6E6|nr:hypothetical protein [Streptomyces niveiscabiei]MDX3384152.1 hypothetical protein [Streptomyces niveiscabiei]
MRARKTRKITVGRDYYWSVRHVHPPCQDVLSLNRDNVRLRLVFAEGPGRIPSGGFTTPGGTVSTPGHDLNLHLPSVVRAFVEEAENRGLFGRSSETDGWELFDAVVQRTTGL